MGRRGHSPCRVCACAAARGARACMRGSTRPCCSVSVSSCLALSWPPAVSCLGLMQSAPGTWCRQTQASPLSISVMFLVLLFQIVYFCPVTSVWRKWVALGSLSPSFLGRRSFCGAPTVRSWPESPLEGPAGGGRGCDCSHGASGLSLALALWGGGTAVPRALAAAWAEPPV